MRQLIATPLTAEKFAPYGDVIALENSEQLSINQGLTTRFHDLFNVDVAAQNGRVLVNVFRTKPLPLPHTVKIMERHPLGSQAFLPMDTVPFLVLVATPKEEIDAADLTLFITTGNQGINFHKNTWHHFQIVTAKQRDFIVIDRGGDGDNLQQTSIKSGAMIALP